MRDVEIGLHFFIPKMDPRLDEQWRFDIRDSDGESCIREARRANRNCLRVDRESAGAALGWCMIAVDSGLLNLKPIAALRRVVWTVT
jgi:hypothetical protein